MTLLIDNYDSFSYNLYQLVGELDPDIRVIRNDAMTVEEIRALKPDRIILSPGPGRPEDAGITLQAAKELGPEFPLLGVCLGHQAICAAFGAVVTYAKALMHGKQSVVQQEGNSRLFRPAPCQQAVGLQAAKLPGQGNRVPDVLRADDAAHA